MPIYRQRQSSGTLFPFLLLFGVALIMWLLYRSFFSGSGSDESEEFGHMVGTHRYKKKSDADAWNNLPVYQGARKFKDALEKKQAQRKMNELKARAGAAGGHVAREGEPEGAHNGLPMPPKPDRHALHGIDPRNPRRLLAEMKERRNRAEAKRGVQVDRPGMEKREQPVENE
jgi:hypothetical protein